MAPVDPSIPLSVKLPQIPTVGDILAQRASLKSLGLQQQMQEAQIADAQAQSQQRTEAVQASQRAERDNQTINGLMQSAMTQNPDGIWTMDRPKFESAIMQAGLGTKLPEYSEQLDRMDTSILKRQQAHNTALAEAGYGIALGDHSPDAIAMVVAPLLKNNVVSQTDVQPYLDAIAKNPASTPQIAKQLMALDPSVIDRYEKRPGNVPIKAAEGEIVNTTDRAQAGLPPLLTGGTKPKTAADLDAAAQAIYAKQALGQPLTPDEQAQKTAYEERKRVISDPAQLAASDRQSAAQVAQIASQQRAQKFTEAQAGRKELSDKVEQPYLDSLEKADTLHTVIDAAKNGNMEAASVQSLLGTLGLVTSEGIKRINTTELQQVAGAGSLLERIKSSVGGITAGQKLSPKLQSDLSQLADLLQQSAYKKYLSGHKATTTRYGLADETPLPSPTGITQTAAIQQPIPGINGGIAESTDGGKTWQRVK